MSYRIIHRKYYNTQAIKEREHFIVEEQVKNFWGNLKWKLVKSAVWYGQDCYRSAVRLKTQDDANNFINRLEAGAPRSEWTSKIVQTR